MQPEKNLPQTPTNAQQRTPDDDLLDKILDRWFTILHARIAEEFGTGTDAAAAVIVLDIRPDQAQQGG